ncbi:MAG: hypothetical protein NWF05_00975 [Candidatus Bathyarchaeota archaeon]|nr:hypothetical protein [Candidatus Bathyarchaeota archaeon]
MTITEESIQTLMMLGLSFSQSKIYFNLTRLGEATVNTVSKVSDVDRGETYRVMSKLREYGLVEKLIVSPIRFKAVPLAEGLTILLTRKKREDQEIRQKAQKMIVNFASVEHGDTLETGESRTFLVPSGEHLANLMHERLVALKESYDVVTFFEEFERHSSEYQEEYKKLLSRGVKIRLIIENLTERQHPVALSKMLQRNPAFKVKFFQGRIPACIGIYDSQEVRISTARKTDVYAVSAYWSNNLVLLTLTQSYFEVIWNRPAKSCPV